METIFERLGGEAAIEAAVADFYDRVLSDVRLAPFFEGLNTDALRAKQRAFMAFALGGAPGLAGRPLREAHDALVERGLDASHFSWTAEHLEATLESLGVDTKLIAEVLETVGSTREDVLGL